MTRSSDIDLIQAQGKLVVFIATLLNRANVVPKAEFAGLLGVFAATVSESHLGEGEILAYWAALVRSAASDTPI